MKLDMLFELQPKPKPWTLPHPYGQRDAEQRVYFEALEQVKLADKLGFGTVWCVEHHFRDGRSACPSNESVLAAFSQITDESASGSGSVSCRRASSTRPASPKRSRPSTS